MRENKNNMIALPRMLRKETVNKRKRSTETMGQNQVALGIKCKARNLNRKRYGGFRIALALSTAAFKRLIC